MFMPLLVLCAIEGTQHSNHHSGVLAAARVLLVRAAMAMHARDGRNPKRFAWRPSQQACAGKVLSGGHTILCFGGKIPSVAANSILGLGVARPHPAGNQHQETAVSSQHSKPQSSLVGHEFPGVMLRLTIA